MQYSAATTEVSIHSI